MAQLIKKENIVVVVGEYTDRQGQPKKQRRTIGEIITMQGNDGSTYQFGKIWGPHGSTEFNVYEQQDQQQAPQQQYQQQYQQPQGANSPQMGAGVSDPSNNDFGPGNADVPF